MPRQGPQRSPLRTASRSRASVALAVALITASAPAAGADGADRVTQADALFREGRALADSGKLEAACPKFLASYQLDAALGTLLNLADCYERTGLTASAWQRFEEAAAAARAAQRPDRERVAKSHATALEARLIRLTVTSADAGAKVTLDGVVLEASELGVARPIDPGQHTLRAVAPDREPYEHVFLAKESVRQLHVKVPPLRRAGEGDAAYDPSRPTTGGRGRGQRTAAWIVMGASVVGAGFGAFFGTRAWSRWSSATDRCFSATSCDQEGVDFGAAAKRDADATTWILVGSGVVAATGVVLYLTAPRPAAPATAVAVGPGTLSLTRSF